MAYDATKPTDDDYLSAFPAEMREQLRAIIQDAIVNALTLNGYSPGNLNGTIPVSNGNLNANLNADKLDGHDATYFSADGHVHAAATQSTNGFMANTDKVKLDGVSTGAEVNQNAFSNVAVGATTIQADSKTDTLTFEAGANIAITPDATNDKVNIAVTGTVPTAAVAGRAISDEGGKIIADTYFPKTGGTISGDLTANTVYSNNWFRNYGDNGWFNETHGGGWYMSDDTWIRSYGDKGVYTGGQMKADGGFYGNLHGTADTANVVQRAIQPRGLNTYNTCIFYGTLTIPQNGDFFKLEVLGGNGFNSDISQSVEGTLYFRTGNGSPANYAAYSEYHRNGANRLKFFIVKDSGTQYRIYSEKTGFTGDMQVLPYINTESSFDLSLTTVSDLPSGAVEVESLQLVYTNTVNNYAPTNTGSGASGTWPISITGSATHAGTADNANTVNGYTAAQLISKVAGGSTPTLTSILDGCYDGNGNKINKIVNASTGISGYGTGDIHLTQSYKNFDKILVVLSNDNTNFKTYSLCDTWQLAYAFSRGLRFDLINASNSSGNWEVWTAVKAGTQTHPLSTETVWYVNGENSVLVDIIGVNY